MDKESACNAGDLGSILGQEDPLEKEMETHSSILAWRIHGVARVGHNLATKSPPPLLLQSGLTGCYKDQTAVVRDGAFC